jgi:hypothetical protein
MEVFLIALPGFLFHAYSTAPMLMGMIVAIYWLRAGERKVYLCSLAGSIAGGAAALMILWGALFGDGLEHSSRAEVIFVVAPIYAVLPQGIAYAISAAVLRRNPEGEEVSPLARNALLIPVIILAIMLVGMLRLSMKGNDLAVAEQARNPATLQRIFEASRAGRADPFGVPLFLAQNPNTPPDILTQLARHEHPSVRGHVAQNPQTPLTVVESLRHDCAAFVREAVQNRLGAEKTALEAPTAPHVCGAYSQR